MKGLKIYSPPSILLLQMCYYSSQYYSTLPLAVSLRRSFVCIYYGNYLKTNLLFTSRTKSVASIMSVNKSQLFKPKSSNSELAQLKKQDFSIVK